MEHLLRDLRIGLRGLGRRHGFALVAVATLALAIGANSAIFSVVRGVLLVPPPFPEPERLVWLWETDRLRGTDQEGVSIPDFFALFAALALALAAVGIYGTVSLGVVERTHEIGVRLALGGDRGDVLRMVLGQGLGLTLAGVAIGLAGALAVRHALASLLFEVGPGDPLTWAAMPAELAAVALAASWLPVRRATAVDPVVALHGE